MTTPNFLDRAARFNFNRAVHLDIMYTKYLAASAANARADINSGFSIAENVMLNIDAALELGDALHPMTVY